MFGPLLLGIDGQMCLTTVARIQNPAKLAFYAIFDVENVGSDPKKPFNYGSEGPRIPNSKFGPARQNAILASKAGLLLFIANAMEVR